MYLNETNWEIKRQGCLLLLRDDIEKTLREDEKNKILYFVQKTFGNDVIQSDMVLKNNFPVENRDVEIEKKIHQLKSSQLVITDRLHGMILAAITGTPCIVIDSKSPKMKGCYEWLKHLDYIQFSECIDDIQSKYELIPKERHYYDNIDIMSKFTELKEALLEMKQI
jgi:pyruvyl transferase EpsI